MKRKEAVYKGLEFTPVYFEDNSLTSPEYFQITEFPTRLTAGKNLFKLRGHPTNLRVGGMLNIEVLDYNGDPIYSEVVDYIDEDKSRVIAIYIYSDTSPGDCTITLIAESATIQGQPVPTQWQNRPNVRWKRTVAVNPNISNVSEIIFDTTPIVTVDELVAVQLDRTYSNGQFPIYSTGQVRYFLLNAQPAIEITSGKFAADMATGTITIATPTNPSPTPSYPISTTGFTSTIKKILSPSIALLDREYTAYSSQSISMHTYMAFDNSAFILDYEAAPEYVETENSQSFAYIQIKELEPATGDVSRVKVFTNNNGTVGNWDLVNDIELQETEIFVSNTASLYPDQSIGTFTTQSTIDSYWLATEYIGPNITTTPTLTWTTASLSNAMQIVTGDLTEKNRVAVVTSKPTYPGVFIEKSAYKTTFDALCETAGKLSIYLSGSSFYQDPTDYFNQEFTTPFGKRIGEITAVSGQRFDDQVFSFESDYTGEGVLNIVIESGAWQIADIRTTSDNDAGYTPNYTRIKTPIETTHKINNQLNFKVEYYNVNGEKSKQISYVYNKNWEGGNRYIDGDYSMLTGSLYVADSLNSGVAISGYPNSGFVRSLGYEGFAAGFPGFLLWSGSAMPNSLGTKGGVPYTGVGLELYANASSYFRYSTTDSEIDVRTDKFFFGNPSTTFISGSGGKLEISSSGFHLRPNGSVTASSFIAVQNGVTLFDSNNQYVDGLNVGRVVYFNQAETVLNLAAIDNGPTNAQTASAFQTFILPGETKCQVSFTYEINNTSASTVGVQCRAYIASASLGPITGTGAYGAFQDNAAIGSVNVVGTAVTAGTIESGAQTIEITTGDTFSERQGMYVQIYLVVYSNQTAATGTVKMKNFVWRTSRAVGGSIIPPSTPIR
jgi:hypothetical protein